MKTSLIAAALMLAIATPALAQAPAAQPTTTQKAIDAAGAMAGKVVGTTTAPAAHATAKAPLVNINKATPAELDALPQIGEARTKAIIGGRPYKASNELVDRKIIPAAAYEAIKDKIAVK